MAKIKKISFVWSADFSVASGLRALKEVAEGQHSCTLCEIAYHRVRQTSDWKRYKKHLAGRLSADIREPCKNQLSEPQQRALAGDYPAVLAHTEQGHIKLLGSTEINACDGDFVQFRQQLDAAIHALLKEAIAAL